MDVKSINASESEPLLRVLSRDDLLKKEIDFNSSGTFEKHASMKNADSNSFAAENNEKEEKLKKELKSNPLLFFIVIGVLSILFLASNTMQYVGVQMMGYYMPMYVQFLNYGTTIIFTIPYYLLALMEKWYKGSRIGVASWRELVELILLGLCTFGNGILNQAAIPKIDPQICAIITQLPSVLMWIVVQILGFCMKEYKFDLYISHILCNIFIVFGFIFSPLLSKFYGSGSQASYENGIWIFMLALSAIPMTFQTIIMERMFKGGCPKFATLANSNALAFIFYILWIPSSMTNLFGTCPCEDTVCLNPDIALKTCPCSARKMLTQQYDSLKCFLGMESPCCLSEGIRPIGWVLIYSFGNFFSYIVSSWILSVDGSRTIANLNALTFMTTTLTFWISIIVGQFSSTPVWWVFVSLVVILVSNLVYSNQSLFAKWDIRIIPIFRKMEFTEEELISFRDEMIKSKNVDTDMIKFTVKMSTKKFCSVNKTRNSRDIHKYFKKLFRKEDFNDNIDLLISKMKTEKITIYF